MCCFKSQEGLVKHFTALSPRLHRRSSASHVSRPPLPPIFIDLTSSAGKTDSDFATMFDLKKRNSLTLTCGRETEEFRRVAVRRRTKGSASTADCRPSHSGKIHKGCSSFVFVCFVLFCLFVAFSQQVLFRL